MTCRQFSKTGVRVCLCGCGQVHLYTFDGDIDDVPGGVVVMTADGALQLAEFLRVAAHKVLNSDTLPVRPVTETLQ